MISEQINQLIKQTITKILQQIEHDSSKLSELTKSSNLQKFIEFSKSTEKILMIENKQFNSKDINYFDFNFENKLTVTEDVITYSEKKTYYKNIHVFVEKITKMTIIFDVEIVRWNPSSCLRKTVFM